jgi:hypothetical protein
MCRSETAQMYRGTYVLFRDGTYVPPKKKSLFLGLKKNKKLEFVLDHFEAFLKVSLKSVDKSGSRH